VRNHSDARALADLMTIEAHDRVAKTAEVNASSFSGSLGGALATGVALGSNTITSKTTASIEGSTVQSGGGDLLIDADSTQGAGDLITHVDASAVGLGLISGAAVGVRAVEIISSDVAAFASDSILLASGAVKVNADSNHTATPSVVGFSASLGVSISVVEVAAKIEGTTRAYIDGNTMVTAGGSTDVTADSIAHALPEGDSIAVGAIGGGIAVMDAQVNRVTEAYVGGRAQTPLVADTRLDRLFLDAQEVPFETGEIVTYSSGGGTAIGGLTNGKQYYVIAGEDGQIQLAEILRDGSNNILSLDKQDNLNARVAIDLTSNGSGTAHSLTRDATAGVTGLEAEGEYLSSIDSFDDTVDPDRLGVDDGGTTFNTGERVVYTVVGGSAIGGLTSGQTYYVIADGVGFVKLAASYEEAQVGDAINLTSTLPAGTHALNRIDMPDPNRLAVDDGGLPFQTGEAVVYTASGSAIGGLTSGQTYYVIGGGEIGFVQLAASAEDAENGSIIDLTGTTLPAGAHTLTRSDVTPVAFNPSADRSTDPSAASTTLSIGNYKLNVLAGSTYEAKADSLTGGFGLLAGATVAKASATVLG
jgi:hypothetical protein